MSIMDIVLLALFLLFLALGLLGLCLACFWRRNEPMVAAANRKAPPSLEEDDPAYERTRVWRPVYGMCL